MVMCGADLSDIDMEILSGIEGNARKKTELDKELDKSKDKNKKH
jgi:hypothetical protein